MKSYLHLTLLLMLSLLISCKEKAKQQIKEVPKDITYIVLSKEKTGNHCELSLVLNQHIELEFIEQLAGEVRKDLSTCDSLTLKYLMHKADSIVLTQFSFAKNTKYASWQQQLSSRDTTLNANASRFLFAQKTIDAQLLIAQEKAREDSSMNLEEAYLSIPSTTLDSITPLISPELAWKLEKYYVLKLIEMESASDTVLAK